MTQKKLLLRIAVVGLGAMGQNHLRILEMMKSVEVAAVVDIDFEKALKVANHLGCKAFSSVSSLAGLVDAAIVAVPSVKHHEIGEFLLSHGIHCLIEKPLASTETECLALIHAAEVSGATLMVGHIERFNPAVLQLRAYLNDGINIHAFEARRMGASGNRIVDVDVVADLMLHDIDVICSFKKADVVSVQGKALSSTGIQHGDYANALLSFEDGSVASLAASRITHKKERGLLVTTDHGSITLNYLAQELHIHRKGQWPDHQPPPSSENHVLDYSTDRFLIRFSEPLPLELHHFIDAVVNRKKPLIDGQDALKTMRIVWEIQKQL
jgi:predicted dehydrogenase